MITVLIVSVAISIGVSALCSLIEAALYAVPLAYARHLAESDSRAGKVLLEFKNSMGRPIAAILILNTVAHTAGASVSGWAVGEVFGSAYLLLFSILYTLAVLYISEILPKVIGVVYCRGVATAVALPLRTIVTLTAPLIRISEFISNRIEHGSETQSLSAQEFLTMTELGTEEGALDHLEGSIVRNIVGLDQVLVKDVLTPRVVVYRLEETKTFADVEQEITECNYTRVPLFSQSNPDFLSGYVTQRDILRELLKGNRSRTLKDILRPIPTVPELLRVDKLLLQMFEEREHICAVVDEHGGLSGIITLEDIVEEIIGQEIVDEYDTVSDMRTFAKIKWFTRHRK